MKTPTSNQFLAAATLAGTGVVSAKLSDGLAAAIPGDSTSVKKVGLTLLGITIAAVGANVKGIAGNAMTGAGLGMAVKQGNDLVTEMINPSIAPKDNSKVSGRFINAIAGHSTIEAGLTKRALNAPWVDIEPAYELESIVDYNEPKALPAGAFV